MHQHDTAILIRCHPAPMSVIIIPTLFLSVLFYYNDLISSLWCGLLVLIQNEMPLYLNYQLKFKISVNNNSVVITTTSGVAIIILLFADINIASFHNPPPTIPRAVLPACSTFQTTQQLHGRSVLIAHWQRNVCFCLDILVLFVLQLNWYNYIHLIHKLDLAD